MNTDAGLYPGLVRLHAVPVVKACTPRGIPEAAAVRLAHVEDGAAQCVAVYLVDFAMIGGVGLGHHHCIGLVGLRHDTLAPVHTPCSPDAGQDIKKEQEYDCRPSHCQPCCTSKISIVSFFSFLSPTLSTQCRQVVRGCNDYSFLIYEMKYILFVHYHCFCHR